LIGSHGCWRAAGGSGVGPMVRERVSEKLSEAEGVDAAR
jgi:hypothetical protein